VSDFFAKAFEGEFKESKTRECVMATDNPDAFALFAEWVYRGQLGKLNFPPKYSKASKSGLLLIDLYILSKKLLLKNDYWLSSKALELLIELHRVGGYLPIRKTTYVYQNTTSTSKLRNYMRDLHCYSTTSTIKIDGPESSISTLMKEAILDCEDLGNDIVMELAEHFRSFPSLKRYPDPRQKRTECYYHDHPPLTADESCPLISPSH
jgi:hypothetical protein